MTGWIKLHRGLLEWEWYSDHNTTRLFLYCLIRANHKDTKYRGIDIKRGDFITSHDKLSTGCGLSVRNVRTCLANLKKTGEVTSKATSRMTILTVCNYSTYNNMTNDTDKPNDKQATSDRQANDKQPTTDKNVKKEKNEEKEHISAPDIGLTQRPEAFAIFKETWAIHSIGMWNSNQTRKEWNGAIDEGFNANAIVQGVRMSAKVAGNIAQGWPVCASHKWISERCWLDQLTDQELSKLKNTTPSQTNSQTDGLIQHGDAPAVDEIPF